MKFSNPSGGYDLAKFYKQPDAARRGETSPKMVNKATSKVISTYPCHPLAIYLGVHTATFPVPIGHVDLGIHRIRHANSRPDGILCVESPTPRLKGVTCSPDFSDPVPYTGAIVVSSLPEYPKDVSPHSKKLQTTSFSSFIRDHNQPVSIEADFMIHFQWMMAIKHAQSCITAVKKRRNVFKVHYGLTPLGSSPILRVYLRCHPVQICPEAWWPHASVISSTCWDRQGGLQGGCIPVLLRLLRSARVRHATTSTEQICIYKCLSFFP